MIIRQTEPHPGLKAHEGLENGWVETSYGRFDPANPTFDIRDIAHSLSLVTRYNGHCHIMYSVAEHSLMVSNLMEGLGLGDPLEGLLHDATEAYLSDVPAPLKQFLPDWQKLDNRIDGALREYFRLPNKKTEGCKKADWLALFIEAYDLLPSRGEIFYDPNGLRQEALKLRENGWVVRFREMATVESDFLTNFKGLYELRLDKRAL